MEKGLKTSEFVIGIVFLLLTWLGTVLKVEMGPWVKMSWPIVAAYIGGRSFRKAFGK